MSKIGRKIIIVPTGVEVKLDGNLIFVKGKLGSFSFLVHPLLKIELVDNRITISRSGGGGNSVKAFWGLNRAKIANMVIGVNEGFTKKLKLVGVGFRAVCENQKLVLNLGFTNPIEYSVPDGIEIVVTKNIISIFGADKELVGQVAAVIRKMRKPEPYKGTGVRYEDEVIKLKPGKKAATAAK
ncbi:50S ribosomal protein L6 [Candidatus Azambacteria bacterium]|nr:50S ribosomal protein L6 [Candidatus Azambacteria bacterium]